MAASSVPTNPCVIGRQILIRGTLVGEEDLVVEGRIEGAITLRGHLIVAQGGVVEANLDIDSIEVHGEVVGDVSASRAIIIERGASVQGNVSAPSVIIRDGARFEGSLEMQVDLPDAIARTISR